ncbi:MAG: CBS domain-containing protein [Eubacteriales bacterium]|jgi:CBS domain-containing protein|nr:CBS domain-containing protein [Eubacteriales bacterium]
MIVKDLMTTNICFVKPDATIMQVAKQMKSENIGLVPVCDNTGVLLGVITDRDIIMRAFVLGTTNLEGLTAKDVMSEHIYTITPEMNIHDAALVFSEHKVRRLPVLENKKLVGILSLTDLAKKKIYLSEIGDIFGAMI